MSQLGGGIGTRGPGETQLETDRRKINLRIDHIKTQLNAVRRIRHEQRQRRDAVPVPVVALVGYTNAGKSTLFNALTEAGVLESARMFATLDPKLRQLQLPSRRRILLSDTVGFIRKLPPTLITSFRATLEEVERAEILLHVQDAASPMREEQKTQVEKVLGELGVSNKPVIQVLNKVDLVPPQELAHLSNDREAVPVSALQRAGLEQLLMAIDAALVVDPLVEADFGSRSRKAPFSPRSRAERSSTKNASKEISSFYELAAQHPFLTVTAVSVRNRILPARACQRRRLPIHPKDDG